MSEIMIINLGVLLKGSLPMEIGSNLASDFSRQFAPSQSPLTRRQQQASTPSIFGA
jgi:hypothetical protein